MADRALKTKANYHGLIHGVFAYALRLGWITTNPAVGTAPKRSRVRQARPELRFLTEKELSRAVALAKTYGDLIAVAAATGLRFGEITALWVSDVDLAARTLRVNKAWKERGEGGSSETPSWLAKQIKDKHAMRAHYLGSPKTPRSRRTISVPPSIAAILAEHVEGKEIDDFVFTTRNRRPIHNRDFHTMSGRTS